MEGFTRGTLARRLVVGFLLVTLPGTIVLGTVTFRAIRSLATVNQQLEEIGLSLQGIQEVHLTLTRAAAAPREFLLRGQEETRHAFQAQFETGLQATERKIATCASSACHGVERSPRQMAELLGTPIADLRRAGRSMLEGAPPLSGGPGSARTVRLDASVALASTRLERMADSLLVRVGDLHREAQTVRSAASTLTISLTILFVLLAGIVAAFLARRISRPLHELLLGIRQVMAGDWGYRVPVTAPAEVAELASSFNGMVERLSHQQDTLEEYSRTLEQRVKERTAELRKTEEALAQSEKLASLGLLASGVAHELNNPLTGVIMYTNLLIEELPGDSRYLKYLRRIDGDAARCKGIIDDLRTFAPRRDLQRTHSPVQTVVEQALAMVAHELDRRAIRTERELPADLPEAVWDRERMVQVFTNLFVNAAQAMNEGGRLTVRARQENGNVVVEVADTGPGIPAENRSRIFDPFFTTKREGTGLGLSICYGIIQEHGGRIDVESITKAEAGPDGATGTTVRMVLPLEHALVEDPERTEHAEAVP